MTQNDGRARPPGAPQRPQRKKLPHERPRWLRPEDEIFFITICCASRGKNRSAIRTLRARSLTRSNSEIKTPFGTRTSFV